MLIAQVAIVARVATKQQGSWMDTRAIDGLHLLIGLHMHALLAFIT
jgi:hypothetical protein